MGSGFSFEDAVSKLINSESRIFQQEEQSEVALLMCRSGITKRCFTCGKARNFAKNCNKNKRHIKCFKCGKVGHIAKNCRTNEAGDDANDRSGTAMITIHQSYVAKEEKAKFKNWNLDSDCTRDIHTTARDVL